MTRQLTPAETRCYFSLYVGLALAAVLWTGTVAATMLPPPRRAVPQSHINPSTINTPREVGAILAEIEEHLVAKEGEIPHDLDARLAAWEKTPEGQKEMRVWRKLQ